MFHIINRIPKDRYEYCFICGEGPGGNFNFQVLDIPRITIPFNQHYSMAMPALAYFKMKRALDRFRPDVIHVASPSLLGNFALEYAGARSIPVVTIYHTHFISYVDYYLKGMPVIADLARSSVIAGQRKFYNKCSLVLVPTEEIKNELAVLGFEQERIKIWRRGIDHIMFNPQKKDNTYLNKITGNKNTNILFASRLVWEKNLETLIKIYDLFEEKNEEVNFIIAGDGIAKNELARQMPKAIFTGKVDQKKLSVLYASADIFLFPSVTETYGSVVVEAMSCGCPCVIARGGGSQSFIRQGINGFLCEPNDPHDYYKRIMMLKSHESLRKLVVREGLDFTRLLNWERLVEEYFSMIDSCASKVTILQ